MAPIIWSTVLQMACWSVSKQLLSNHQRMNTASP
nr:MAG TPA: hypothetical protein [Caudoviricetes sp.]